VSVGSCCLLSKAKLPLSRQKPQVQLVLNTESSIFFIGPPSPIDPKVKLPQYTCSLYTPSEQCLASIPVTRCDGLLTLFDLSSQANGLFLQKHMFKLSDAISVISNFKDLGLKEDLLRGIYAHSVHATDLSCTSLPNTSSIQTVKSPLQFSSMPSFP